MAKGKQQDAANNAAVNDEATDTESVNTDFGVLSAEELTALGLTDEERTAVTSSEDEVEDEADEGGDDGSEAGDDTGEEESGDAGDGEENDADDGESGEAGEEADDADDGEAGDDADEGEGDEEEDEGDDEEVTDEDVADLVAMMPAVPDWKAPEDAEENLKQIETRAEEIAGRFDEGDIGAAEFHKEMAKVNADRGAINEQINRAKMAHDMRFTGWTDRVVPKFLSLHEIYQNEIALSALDRAVQDLQQKSDDPFDPKLLMQAHNNIAKAFGFGGSKAKAGGEQADNADNGKKPAGGGKKKLAGKKGAKTPKELGETPPTTPKTLARVPADEVDDQSGGKWARLDRLQATNPDKFEAALLNMTPEQRAAYENA